MSKLAIEVSKRIIAVALSIAMVMSNMTVYASELSGSQPQAEETVEDAADGAGTDEDAEESSSTKDESASEERSKTEDAGEEEQVSEEEEAETKPSLSEDKEEAKDSRADDLKADDGETGNTTAEVTGQENVTKWDFANASDFTASPYKGLQYSNATHNQDKYLLAAADSTITVPVDNSKAGKIKVTACYGYSFSFENGEKIARSSKSTSVLDTFEYYYETGTETVVINVKGQSYFNSIEIDMENLTITETNEWDFTKYKDYDSNAEDQKTLITEWNGLLTSKGKYHGSKYGLTIADDIIKVPVKGNCTISVDVDYTWDFGFFNLDHSNVQTSATNTVTDANYQPYTYPYTGGKGMVPIIVGKSTSSYIKKITVTYASENAHSISFEESEYGTAIASPVYAEAGNTVTLAAKPDEGYMLEKWEVVSPIENKPEITSDGNDPNKATFSMPASDVKIKAVFVEDAGATYDVHVLNGYHGTASLKEGKGTGISKDEEVVLADVVEAAADEGYTFDRWYVTQTTGETTTDVSVTDGKFTMPTGDVYVIPIFTGAAKNGYLYNFKNATKKDRYQGSQIADFGIITFDGLQDENNDHGFKTNKENATMTLTLSDEATVTVETCKWNAVSTGMTAAIGETTYTPDEETTSEGGKQYTVNTDKAGELVLTFATQNNYVHSIKVEYNGTAGDETLDFNGKYFKTVDFTTLEGLTKGDNISTADIEGLLVNKDEAEVTYFDNKHGALTSQGATLNLNLEKKANIAILGCSYGKSTQITASSKTEEGTKTYKVAKEDGPDEDNTKRTPPLYTILGAEGVVTLKVNNQEYIHSITVTELDADAAEQYLVTVTNDGHGTTTSDKAYAETGSVVTLTAEPKSGYAFKEWEVSSPESLTITPDEEDDTKFTFTMPENDVEVNAVFEATETIYVAEGTYDLTPSTASLVIDGFTFTGFEPTSSGHGFSFSDGATMKLSLKEKANITVLSCCYGGATGGPNVTMTASAGKVNGVEEVEEAGKPNRMKFTVLSAPAGELTLTFGGASWIHSVTVEYPGEVEVGSRNIDVWDFGGLAETNTDVFVYNNNITVDELKEIVNSATTSAKGQFKAGTTAFGDLTMNHSATGDRLYTDIKELSDYNYGSYSNAQYKYADYTSAGAWYCNGTGGGSRRYVTIKMQAGDKLIAYMGSSQSGDIEFLFEGQGGAEGQTDSVTITSGTFEKCEFVAEKTGTYKVYATNDSKGKPMYHRFVRVPGIAVSGTINYDGHKDAVANAVVKFKNTTTKTETEAEVDADGNFSAILAAGYEYRAVLSGAMGYSFDAQSKYFETKDEEYKTGKSGVELKVVTQTVYTYSGEIVGFAEDYDVSKLAVTMVADKEAETEDVELEITQADKITFTATLLPEVKYTFELEGVNDYEVIEPSDVNNEDGSDYTNSTITVQLKAVYPVTGAFVGLDDSAQVSKLTFTNVEDKYVYDAVVNEDGKGYSVELRDGEYLATATVTNFSTQTHVVVDGAAASKDLMFVSTAAKDKIDYVADIYVGYPNQANNYETVSKAMEACDLMNPAPTSNSRVTVHIAPGEYREQIIVNTPYISFVNDTDKEVLLTWYYGIGYKYYSADSSGYFNPENAYDKYEKNIAAKWGVAVYVKNTAKAFRAEGITFENSFNRYVTDEELEDGVEVSGTESITVERKRNTDVTSKAATERAAAIAVEGDEAEFRNCGFYSSQDTVYTGAVKAYFKNCVIEGQTDYIFGDTSSVVFDACELSWKGYSSNSQGGYITAPRANGAQGYLFRNCTVTANSHNKLTVTAGYFGRPWGPDAKVIFMNTKLQSADMITAAGWNDMSGNQPENANFYEYNTTTAAGASVDTGSRKGHVMNAEDAAKINVTDYFGSWVPSYFVAEADTVEFAEELRVTDNGDINAPYPGHTLTVRYSLGAANDANDASVIQWYIVDKDGDGTETLVKTSTATVDKTYQIQKTAIGKYIKVTVTPQTVSGKVGEPASYIVEEVVRDGWDDPSGGADITLGDGVNIFLAGDSTVKDYSASGMWNSGSALKEGSWGEFIQNFFDSSKVTIQNFAQGGRSSRTFINEGKLKSIEEKISEGDYLFIQFGHNDSSDTYPDRYVPLGTPDGNGVYPSIEGTKDASGEYPNGGEGTFKWFLKQYIDAAKAKGAIPVLVTPVARMYYNSDGTIKAHHDSSSSSNNAYVTAIKQLAEEENVLLIDGYELTKNLFEAAWKADGNNNDTYGRQIMADGDKTHNNKLGGMIEAAAIASAIQDMGLNISSVVKAPENVLGETPDGKEVFSVNRQGKLTAYDILTEYTAKAVYWESIGQAMFDAIKEKAGNNPDPGPGPVDPTDTVAAPVANIPSGTPVRPNTEIVLSSATEGAKIYYTTDGTTTPNTENGTLYAAPIPLTADTIIKAIAVKDGYKDSEIVTFAYTVSADAPAVYPPVANIGTGTAVESGTEIVLSCVPADAKIYYTIDGTDPTEASSLYESPIKITADTTIKAIAVKDGETSAVSTFVYTLKTGEEPGPDVPGAVSRPVSDVPSGEVTRGTKITLSTATEGAKIYYTEDGTVPSLNSTEYTKPISITKDTTILAIAVKDGVLSEVAEFKYTIRKGSVSEGLEVIVDGEAYPYNPGTVVNINASPTYTGSAVTLDVFVTNNGEELVEGIDYTVKYANNIKASKDVAQNKKPKITITGKNNLKGSATLYFEIEPKSIADTEDGITAPGSLTVAENSKAAPILYYGNLKLNVKKDFNIGENNADAAKKWQTSDTDGSITLIGVGNYTGQRKIDVNVVAKSDLQKFKVTLDPDKLMKDWAYGDGKDHTPLFAVNNSKTKEALTPDSDYIVAYPSDMTSAGSKKFTVIGTGLYTGCSVTKSYTIKPCTNAANITIDKSGMQSEYPYARAGVTFNDGDLTITNDGITLREGRDYKITYSGNKKVSDKAKYTVNFMGNYKGVKGVENQTGLFTIAQADLGEQNWKAAASDQIYKKPGIYKTKLYVTVDDVLLKGSDYTVTYVLSDGTEMKGSNKLDLSKVNGTVTVKIAGKGNYKGEIQTTYKVGAAEGQKIDLSKAKVTVVDADGSKLKNVVFDGHEQYPDILVEVKDGSFKNVKEVVAEEEYKSLMDNVTYINNVNKGKATIVVNGDGSKFVGSKVVTFSIVSKDITSK